MATSVTLKPNAIDISGSTSGVTTLQASGVAGTTTLTLPAATDTLVSRNTTDTLTNKTLTSPVLVTPALGTPTSGVMTNVTGINYNGFKNRIINGAMVINQRATSLTAGGYLVDRWEYVASAASKATITQSTTAITGFINSLLATSSSAYSVAAGDFFALGQKIEGLNISDLAWGTASAATVTLSFWVRSSLTGTFGGALRNSAADRSYPFSYTINAANTFEQKTIIIAGDTSGTWLTTNGTGIRLTLGFGVGTTFSSTAGAWGAGNFLSATGATSVVGTNGATFYITGVQLEKGSTATSFDYRPYGTELALCQRYCFVPASNSRYVGQCDGTTRALIVYVFPQTMRAGASATLATPSAYVLNDATGGTVAGTSIVLGGGFTDSAQLAITVASGLVAGNATLITASGTTIFSAEL